MLGQSLEFCRPVSFLMFQLLWYEGYGDWSYINSWSDATLAVTEEDVKRVAAEIFAVTNRTVAVIETTEDES